MCFCFFLIKFFLGYFGSKYLLNKIKFENNKYIFFNVNCLKILNELNKN